MKESAKEMLAASRVMIGKEPYPDQPSDPRASLREAIEDIKNAKPEKALEMLRACQLCGKCSMVCPRGINTRHLILSITKVYSAK